MDSNESAITTWEDVLAPFKCALGRVCTKCDAENAQTEAV
jgi:hypothetical protein